MDSSTSVRPLADAAELIRLRWVGVAVQVAVVSVAAAAGFWKVAPVLALLVVVGIASNIVLERRSTPIPESVMAGLIALDTALLTAVLVITGGAFSPYTPLYLIYTVLAALFLRPTLAWASMIIVLSTYGAMVLVEAPVAMLPARGLMANASHDINGHITGMFASVSIASPFLVATLLRARRTLTTADNLLAHARVAEERSRRLSSLATLAAGASHELATPLGTIAVAAKELIRHAEPDSTQAKDAALIRSEVGRCRRVLHELTADVGTTTGEQHQSVLLGDLLDLILVGYGDEIDVEMDEALESRCCVMPARLVSQAVRRLLGNARSASPAGQTVLLRVDVKHDQLQFEIIDHGRGMEPDVLARALEPFFTTRPTGVGMGLGLWFTQSVAEQLGGTLQLLSAPDAGTQAFFYLPISTSPKES
ncbi:MAG: HAMP domain-containing histidine kinase [Oligoflexia bacterium]|nr:HAMP domain-containing histidine kinase [Oligoflexia bacterium]